MSNDYNALIVGVGDYPKGLDKLRAVAADVREVAELLGSRSGIFDTTEITLKVHGTCPSRGDLRIEGNERIRARA